MARQYSVVSRVLIGCACRSYCDWHCQPCNNLSGYLQQCRYFEDVNVFAKEIHSTSKHNQLGYT